MIKALRRKFILVTMALLFAVFAIALTALNIMVRTDRKQTILEEMRALSSASRIPRFMLKEDSETPALLLPDEEKDPEPSPAPKNLPRKRRSWSDDMAFKEMYVVLVDESGGLIGSAGMFDFNISEKEINDLAAQSLAKKHSSGKISHFLFHKTVRNYGRTLIILRNVSEDIAANRQMLVNSVLIGLGALALLFLITLLLSRIVTKPAEHAFSQQKQFIADASHELKTPLSAISINAEVLKEEIEPNQWLENIIHECGRMEELVLSLLTLAKLDDGKRNTLVFEKQDLSELCNESVLTFECIAYEKGIHFDSDIEERIIIQGSRTELKQLLSILLDNAFKYVSPHGNVKISLSKKDKVILSVSNTGPTIGPEALPHLFDRFYRADSARTGDNSFGLGLAIAAETVKAHKGHIGVKSQDNFTVFTVVF